MKRRGAPVIVSGILFWYPLAGVTWQFLHYLEGLRRLGWDPYYVEDSGRWVYDPALDDLSPDAGPNVSVVGEELDRRGFAGRWAFRGRYPGGRCLGMSESDLARLYREAVAFLNVTGAQEMTDEHLRCPRRIYVETDPVAMQIRVVQGDAQAIAMLEAHDTLFTFGENLGAADCGVPVERFRWLPTRQPVLLDHWEAPPAPAEAAYTTIATWQNTGKDVTYRGETYSWSKDREFAKVLDLPRRRAVPFELALGAPAEVCQRLAAQGWRVVNAVEVSRDVARYRQYVQGSRAEFTVAKDQNIRLRSGWFSDRSACYLAAGRPVITQETGFSNVLPTGKGLFGFAGIDDVLAAVDAIESDYEGHCRAAREVAAEHFDAEKVLASLMGRAGL